MGHDLLLAPEDPGTETLRVPVLRVFDGDGFLTQISNPLRSTHLRAAVRFGFIDAPELEQPGGPEAKDFLEHLIGGQWIDLVILTKMDTGGIVDRHGRIVAVPYLKSKRSSSPTSYVHRNIELEMVLNGWAWVLERYCPEQHYFDALEDAQRHRRGIWALTDNVHPWEFKKRRYRERRAQNSSRPIQPRLFPD